MDITSASIRATPNGSNFVNNFALKFMFFGFFGFKLLLAEDSVRNRVSKNLGNPET